MDDDNLHVWLHLRLGLLCLQGLSGWPYNCVVITFYVSARQSFYIQEYSVCESMAVFGHLLWVFDMAIVDLDGSPKCMFIAVISILLLLATFIYSCIVMHNFGRGLKKQCEFRFLAWSTLILNPKQWQRMVAQLSMELNTYIVDPWVHIQIGWASSSFSSFHGTFLFIICTFTLYFFLCLPEPSGSDSHFSRLHTDFQLQSTYLHLFSWFILYFVNTLDCWLYYSTCVHTWIRFYCGTPPTTDTPAVHDESSSTKLPE